MAAKNKDVKRLVTSLRQLSNRQWPSIRLSPYGRRGFQTTATSHTDGVFHGLADTRLPMPWIEAFRLQQQGNPPGKAEDYPEERDLTPKKMSDSYHRVVLPLGQDPWLSDTYINSSGHIRCVTNPRLK